jgi:hypothetical protein
MYYFHSIFFFVVSFDISCYKYYLIC